MKFAGKVWKLLVGIKDGLVLLFMLLFFALLYAAMTARPTLGAGDRGALLLELDGPIVEQPAQATASEVFSGGGPREYRLRDVVHALEVAATDDRVKAVALDLDIFSGGGQATLSSVGEALDSVRKAGKPVLAYATAYDDDSYQLAAPCQRAVAQSDGRSARHRPGRRQPLHEGPARQARESPPTSIGPAPTRRRPSRSPATDMSPEAREALTAVYGSMWESWQQEVRQARPKAQLAPYIADMPGRIAAAGGDMARAALQAGLVDRIGEPRRVRPPGRRDRRHPLRRRSRQLPSHRLPQLGRGQSGQRRRAARSESSPSPATSSTARPISAPPARRRSSGRSRRAFASATSRRWWSGSIPAAARPSPRSGSARRCSPPRRRACRSWCRWAASPPPGGYWVATAGDRIFAEPSTITGSIGVFGILPSFEGAMAKLGPRRRRREDDSAVGRAGPAARPLARGRPAAADGRRRHLPPLPRSGLGGAQDAGRPRSTGSPRAGSGTAAPPASSASSTRSAASTTPSARRRGWRGSIPSEARGGLAREGARFRRPAADVAGRRRRGGSLARRVQPPRRQAAAQDAGRDRRGRAAGLAAPPSRRAASNAPATRAARRGSRPRRLRRPGWRACSAHEAEGRDARRRRGHRRNLRALRDGERGVVRDRAARTRRRCGRGSRPAASSIPGWSAEARTGRSARLCLCRPLPRPPGLSLHRRDERLSARRRRRPRARAAALRAAARNAGGAGLHPGDRRHHPAERGQRAPARTARLRARRDLPAGRLEARRVARRRAVAEGAGGAGTPPAKPAQARFPILAGAEGPARSAVE